MSRAVKFIVQFGDVLLISIGLLLWWFSVDLLQYLDYTAATFSRGHIQRVIFGVVALFVGNGVALLVFRLRFPSIFKYLMGDGADDFLEIPLRDRVWIVVSIFSVLLLSFSILVAAM